MNFFLCNSNEAGAEELGLQDEFAFGCDMCGECCDALERVVVLSGPDVARVSKYLTISKQEFLDFYTATLTDPANGFPHVVLKPQADGRGCVLQNAGKCRVHAAKPRACALYPLSREVAWDRFENGSFYPSVKYTANADSFLCGSASRLFTVEEWLYESNVPIDDAEDIEWTALLAGLAEEHRRRPMAGTTLYHDLYVSDRW